MRRMYWVSLLLTVVVSGFNGSAHCAEYRLIDLGTLGMRHSLAFGISDSLLVEGTCDNFPYNGSKSFEWDPENGMRDVPIKSAEYYEQLNWNNEWGQTIVSPGRQHSAW